MIFIRNKNITEIKKVLDQDYMFSFFNKKKKFFLNSSEKLIGLKIHLLRNFQGKYQNMTLRYELLTSQKKKFFQARIHRYQDLPEREWKVFNYLREKGLSSFIPQKLYYYSPLNILFYLQIPGKSFENLLTQKKVNSFLKFTPLIAQTLFKIHLTQGPDLPLKNKEQEKKERRHWFFLVRKCAPSFYPVFSQLLKRIWQLKQNKLFLKPTEFKLVHSDFHWGNIIKNKDKFSFIDFSYAFCGDPLEDVGGFLAQNDSMFSYYASDHQEKKEKIRQAFIKNYFRSGISLSQQNRLFYFEIQKILEMAAILAFVEPNPRSKKQGMNNLFARARQKIKEWEAYLNSI
jgi:thiamine kinase-like enzyme